MEEVHSPGSSRRDSRDQDAEVSDFSDCYQRNTANYVLSKCQQEEDLQLRTHVKNQKLDAIFNLVSHTILKFQSPTSGLFPAETTPECAIADVRTSIYCALSIWSLHLAYCKILSDDGGRSHLLGQTAVKTMRGILRSWMYQIDKVRDFVVNQIPQNALHIVFDMETGEALPNNEDCPHLQMDCISLFLISLVQMISSGLKIIYTSHEVDFVQTLVFCIERTYRIADFGMWGRGSKYNNGTPELNASSVGMAKAAMEAVNGFNLFGDQGASWSVVYVDIDAHMRNRIVFENLMPRESSSKSSDSALLPALTWPCFAIHDTKLKEETLSSIIEKLKGRYGIKRFLRDGYGTVFEDRARKFYNAAEIKNFDGVECEFPFLNFFLIIDAVFSGDMETAKEYLMEVEAHLKLTDGGLIVPKYYYVPRDFVQAERDNPGGCNKLPSDEGPDGKYFLWGQSVFVVMRVLVEGLLPANELDPIKRHLSASERPRFSHRYTSFEASAKGRLVQVSIIAESVRLQQSLATHGIPSQTPVQVEPIQVWSPNEIKKALRNLGVNDRLKLAGRPERPVGLLGTSIFYRICGQTVISYPLLFEVNDFYISQDLNSVIDAVQHDISILANTWKLSGRPTYVVMITEAMVQSANVKDLIDLLASFKSGLTTQGIRVKLDRLQSMATSGTIEHLDFLKAFVDIWEEPRTLAELNFSKIQEKTHEQFSQIKLSLTARRESRKCNPMKDLANYPDWKLQDLYNSTEDGHVRSQVLKYLLERHGKNHVVGGATIGDLLEKIRLSSSQGMVQNWSVVRLCSALLGKVVDSLAPSITNILVRGKLVTLGVFGHEEKEISKPLNPSTIGSMLYSLCSEIEPREAVLQQELILILGQLHSTSPYLFDGILRVRVGWIVHAMQYALSYDSPDTSIFSLAPSEINSLLNKILRPNHDGNQNRSVFWKRQLHGSLGHVPRNFYAKIWYILQQTPGGIRIDNFHLPQQPTLSDLTLHELNFALYVEDMLGVLRDPLYRHVIVEALMVVSVVLERNPELSFENYIDMTQIMNTVFSQFKATLPKKDATTDEEAKNAFFRASMDGANGTFSFMAKAICSLLLENRMEVGRHIDDCLIM